MTKKKSLSNVLWAAAIVSLLLNLSVVAGGFGIGPAVPKHVALLGLALSAILCAGAAISRRN